MNLNPHLHIIFFDGVYVNGNKRSLKFHWVKAPISEELLQLTQTIAHRISRFLEHLGLLERDTENSYLTTEKI